MTAALAAIVDAKLRADYSRWYPGVGQTPPRIDIYASDERDGVLHVHFIADSYVYNQPQSGSDWADHYFYAGEATLDGDAVRSHSLVLVEHVGVTERETYDYDDRPMLANVRERLVTRAPQAIRCPTCRSTKAGIHELVFDLIRLTCDACGHTELTGHEGLASWTARPQVQPSLGSPRSM